MLGKITEDQKELQALDAGAAAFERHGAQVPVTVTCEEWDQELQANSPGLRLVLTDEGLLMYCEACYEREFGKS